MAPSLSKLTEYKSGLICLSGLAAAGWIIIYGKSSNKKRLVFQNGIIKRTLRRRAYLEREKRNETKHRISRSIVYHFY